MRNQTKLKSIRATELGSYAIKEAPRAIVIIFESQHSSDLDKINEITDDEYNDIEQKKHHPDANPTIPITKKAADNQPILAQEASGLRILR